MQSCIVLLNIVGDFNDFDPDIQSVYGVAPKSRVLEFLKFPQGIKKGQQLYNVASKLPNEDELYSCWYDKNNNCIVEPGEYSLIDHILVTKGLYNKIKGVKYYNHYDVSCNTYHSDHWPLVITIDIA